MLNGGVKHHNKDNMRIIMRIIILIMPYIHCIYGIINIIICLLHTRAHTLFCYIVVYICTSLIVIDELNMVGPIVNKCNALWSRPHLTVLS